MYTLSSCVLCKLVLYHGETNLSPVWFKYNSPTNVGFVGDNLNYLRYEETEVHDYLSNSLFTVVDICLVSRILWSTDEFNLYLKLDRI